MSNQQVFLPNRIVSGGQTGVDRAALEVAIALNIAHGGWCPAGRLSEDGTIPSRYEVRETESSEYPVRTEQNVIESDATLIIYENRLQGGTLLTRRICQTRDKPVCVAKLNDKSIDIVRTWLSDVRPKTLNVAGPRESKSPGITERSTEFLLSVFAHHG